jgi:osmoprotectant transport system permease protein
VVLRGLVDAASPVAANGPGSWLWWEWIPDHADAIRANLVEHIVLTGWSVLFGVVIAAPLAVLARRRRATRGALVAVANVLYTLPSVAVLGILFPIFGLERRTAVIALTAYTLAILVRAMLDGLDSVAPEVLDAADGMGYSRGARLFRVELPLAAPAILTGIRQATVSTIGLVTVTFIVSQGGLGRFIAESYRRDFRTPLTVATVLSFALAVAADLMLVFVGRIALPWKRVERP